MPPECEVLPAPEKPTESVTVAILDAVDPEHAPWARNAGEQLMFRLLYETLFVVDCAEDVRAGLAESWKSDRRGRRWTFRLREDAQFWDGSPVTAADVVTSWQDALTLDTDVDSITVADDRSLHVYFQKRHRRVPRALAATVFAVTRSSGTSDWLLGTGPYRVETSNRGHATGSERVTTLVPTADDDWPAVRFLETTVRDARDLLESDIDVIVTSDPDVIEYAASRPRLSTAAMPWDKTYALLSTTRFEKIRWGEELRGIPSVLLDELARDAVSCDARGSQPLSWWDDVKNCSDMSLDFAWLEVSLQGAVLSSVTKRIVYDASDPVARDLAERIVALAATDPATSWEAAEIASAVPGLVGGGSAVAAAGMTADQMRSILRAGDEFAYIISFPRRPPDPCFETSEFVRRAPWMMILGEKFTDALIPLVDTRPHVIANVEKAGLAVDWYSGILVVERATGQR